MFSPMSIPRVSDFDSPRIFSGRAADFPAYALRLDYSLRSVTSFGLADMSTYIQSFAMPADRVRAAYVLFNYITMSLSDDLLVTFDGFLQQDSTPNDPVALWKHLSSAYDTFATVHRPPVPILQELLAARISSPSSLVEHLIEMRNIWGRFLRADNVGPQSINLFVSFLINSLSECHALESLRRDLAKFTGPSAPEATMDAISNICRIALVAMTVASPQSSIASSVTSDGPCDRCKHPHCPAPDASQCLALQCFRCHVFGHTSDRCVKCPTCHVQGHFCVNGTKMYPKFRTGKASKKRTTDPSELSPATGAPLPRQLALAAMDPQHGGARLDAMSTLSKSEKYHQSSDLPRSYRDAASRGADRTSTCSPRLNNARRSSRAPPRHSARPSKQADRISDRKAVKNRESGRAVETSFSQSLQRARAFANAPYLALGAYDPEYTTRPVASDEVRCSPEPVVTTPEFSDTDMPLESDDPISSTSLVGGVFDLKPTPPAHSTTTTVVYSPASLRHVFNDSSLFVEWSSSTSETIKGADGQPHPCRVGTVHLSVPAVAVTGKPCVIPLVLRDVLYHPDAPSNVVSHYLMCTDDFTVDAESLTDPEGNTMRLEKIRSGVYIFFAAHPDPSNPIDSRPASAAIQHHCDLQSRSTDAIREP